MNIIYYRDGKAEFLASLCQSSVSHDPQNCCTIFVLYIHSVRSCLNYSLSATTIVTNG